LLFLSVFLLRVIPTLCFNYLSISGVEGNVGIGFSKVMGAMRLEDLKVLGDIFYVFSIVFPLLIVLVALLTAFNFIARCLNIFGFLKQFDYVQNFELDDSVMDGREILRRERKRITKRKGFHEKSDSKENKKTTIDTILNLGIRVEKKKLNSYDSDE
jgi:hypothetical protein